MPENRFSLLDDLRGRIGFDGDRLSQGLRAAEPSAALTRGNTVIDADYDMALAA